METFKSLFDESIQNGQYEVGLKERIRGYNDPRYCHSKKGSQLIQHDNSENEGMSDNVIHGTQLSIAYLIMKTPLHNTPNCLHWAESPISDNGISEVSNTIKLHDKYDKIIVSIALEKLDSGLYNIHKIYALLSVDAVKGIIWALKSDQLPIIQDGSNYQALVSFFAEILDNNTPKKYETNLTIH